MDFFDGMLYFFSLKWLMFFSSLLLDKISHVESLYLSAMNRDNIFTPGPVSENLMTSTGMIIEIAEVVCNSSKLGQRNRRPGLFKSLNQPFNFH